MEVKADYKQTEIGVIPAEWDVSPLGDCLCAHPAYGINAAAVPYSDQLPVYIRITDISGDGVFLPAPRVSVRSEMSHAYLLADGDIVFARTGASVGKSYRYNPSDGPLVYAGFLIRVRPDPEKLLPAFAASYVKTGSYWRWVRLMSMRSGQPGINGNEYAQLLIPLPPLSEQRAIATALSDVDALIAGLENLIAKKRDIKQAAMQQLLTGQTRLPGFSGKWEEKRLGGALTICHGKNQRAVEVADGPYPILATGGQIGTAREALYDRPSVLIGRKGTIDQPRYMDTPFWTVDTLYYSVMKGDACAKFFYYLFCLIPWKQYNEASGVPSLNARTIERIEITCPEPSEQRAIATVLSEIDTELATIESRLTKTRSIKQGMMQELLTGRTRLV